MAYIFSFFFGRQGSRKRNAKGVSNISGGENGKRRYRKSFQVGGMAKIACNAAWPVPVEGKRDTKQRQRGWRRHAAVILPGAGVEQNFGARAVPPVALCCGH